MQSRTALADTAGSAFNQQCRELLEQGDFEGVLDKIIEQFPLLFTKGAAGALTNLPTKELRSALKRTWLRIEYIGHKGQRPCQCPP